MEGSCTPTVAKSEFVTACASFAGNMDIEPVSNAPTSTIAVVPRPFFFPFNTISSTTTTIIPTAAIIPATNGMLTEDFGSSPFVVNVFVTVSPASIFPMDSSFFKASLS